MRPPLCEWPVLQTHGRTCVRPSARVTGAGARAGPACQRAAHPSALLRPPMRSWAVLRTTSGALAGRFTDTLDPTEPVVSNENYFLADIVGNSSFKFNTSQDLIWWPQAQVGLPRLFAASPARLFATSPA